MKNYKKLATVLSTLTLSFALLSNGAYAGGGGTIDTIDMGSERTFYDEILEERHNEFLNQSGQTLTQPLVRDRNEGISTESLAELANLLGASLQTLAATSSNLSQDINSSVANLQSIVAQTSADGVVETQELYAIRRVALSIRSELNRLNHRHVRIAKCMFPHDEMNNAITSTNNFLRATYRYVR